MSEKILNVYVAVWCPHCRAALEFLKTRGIKCRVHDIEKVTPEVERLVDEANGGEWRVPTLECGGKWVPGRAFDKRSFEESLKELGII